MRVVPNWKAPNFAGFLLVIHGLLHQEFQQTRGVEGFSGELGPTRGVEKAGLLWSRGFVIHSFGITFQGVNRLHSRLEGTHWLLLPLASTHLFCPPEKGAFPAEGDFLFDWGGLTWV